jgi:hypothetical protein
MKLAPIDLWRSHDSARKDFTEAINSGGFRTALSFALAAYQAEVCHLPEGAAMLRGANGIVDKIMNMGELKSTRKPIDFQLPNPDELTIQHR